MNADKKQADQLARFLETARKLECDEDKELFEMKLGKIAQPNAGLAVPPTKGSRRRQTRVTGNE